jgi:hypothetical protein
MDGHGTAVTGEAGDVSDSDGTQIRRQQKRSMSDPSVHVGGDADARLAMVADELIADRLNPARQREVRCVRCGRSFGSMANASGGWFVSRGLQEGLDECRGLGFGVEVGGAVRWRHTGQPPEIVDAFDDIILVGSADGACLAAATVPGPLDG